jgi:hypothetical protein
MHDLLKRSGNAALQLITTSTDFDSVYEVMRKHAAGQIEANVHWGATKELNTNNLYEILDGRNRILLRYELDAVSPNGEDTDGIQIWNRASASPALLVHYGMYIGLHCDTRDRTEHFFVGGFKSLGEASYAMKQSAATYLQGHSEAKLYEKSIEVVNKKGQLQQRFTIQKGRQNENGSFVKEADWHLEQDSTDSKVPVTRLPTPGTSKSSKLPTAQTNVPQIVTEIVREAKPHAVLQVPAHVVSEPQAVRDTRRYSQRLQSHIEPSNDKVGEEQPKIKPQAKQKAPVKSRTLAKPKFQVQAPHDFTPHCTCRLPDDGSLMIGCDNEKCPIGWYHGRCINVHQAMPENEVWYCEMCTRERENKKVRGMDTLAVNISGKTPVKKGECSGGKTQGKAKKRKLS